MKRLYLLRHGETDGSAHLRYCGQTDIPLNKDGIEQARQLARRLSKEPIDVIYSSDLIRAYETAAIVARGRGLNVKRNKNLREIHLGDWEGLTMEEMRAKDTDLVDKWMVEFSTFRMPNGESIPGFKARVEKGIKDIISKNSGTNVAVVAHGGVTRMVLCYLLGWDLSSFWRVRQDTACVNIIDFVDGEPELVCLNNHDVTKR